MEITLDALDEHIVWELTRNARLSNKELADRVGLAPSTCLVRVRALHEAGVIRSYHAHPDWAALGLSVEAIVAVRLRAQARGEIETYAQRVITLPNVINVFFLGGADDFFIHVACASTAQLRDFVAQQLSMDTSVASTQTNIVFDHLSGIEHMGPGTGWADARRSRGPRPRDPSERERVH
ncbi:MAG: AsnC family transcriptional regulator [Frondihabitans sp.]|nr:AsnC family transcriptional regulator [Frondihabitans sp.]